MTTTTTSMEEVKPFKDKSWSHSSASSCPQVLLWRQNKFKGSGRPDRIVAIDRRDRGSFLHDAAELSLKTLRTHGKWPVPARVCEHILIKGGDRGEGYSTMSDVVGELVVKVALFQECFRFSMDDHLGSEWRLCIDPTGQTCSYDDPPVGSWRGKIDWAEISEAGAIRVIDFKNRPAIHPKSELMSHDQLLGYAWMLGCLYPQARKHHATIGIYYFEYGVTDEVEVTWDDVDAAMRRQRAKVNRLAGLKVLDVKPEPGFGRCQYCDHLSDCPEGLSLLDDKTSAPVDKETAVALAKQLFVIDELYSASRAALKRYAEEHGPVAISDDTGYGFVVKTETEINTKLVIAELRAAGKDMWPALRIDKDELKKLIRDDKELQVRIGKHTKTREVTRFDSYKPKKDNVQATPMVDARVRRKKDK